MVAERYQEASGETLLRDGPDLRRHFIQKLCNRGIKPTGNSGEKNGATKRAQEIYESILVKESVANFGELMMTMIMTTSKRATRKKRTI